MDAVAYQMSFDKEQLALLCANYDRRIDSLGVENKRFKAENAKLRELVNAQCECVKHDDCGECVHYSEGKCTFPFKVMHRELGIEVDE